MTTLLKRNARPSTKAVQTEYKTQESAPFGLAKLKATSGWRHKTQVQWLVVLGLMVLAFFMRRKGLATQSLWFDEADLVSRASQDLPTILKSFFKPGENGPLYTLLMHFWLQIAGLGEAAVRTPSMLAGTAAVPMIFLVGKQLGGVALGLMGAFLLSISPYHLWYSQDAKMYPLALCITLASVYLFLRGLHSDHKGWWVAYVIITTLGFYIHLMIVLIVGVEVAYYFLVGQRLTSPHTAPKKRVFISLGLLTLPYLPIAIWQLVALRDGTVGNGWFQPVGLFDMFDSLGRRFGVNRSVAPWEEIGALTYAGLAGLGLVVAWLGLGRRFKTPRPAILFLTIYFLLPILAFYLLSMRIPLFADRYLLIASPAYYLLVAGGLLWLLEKFWPVGVIGLGLALVSVGIALGSFNYSTQPQKEDWREAMRWLSEQVRPGDEVFVIPGYLDSAVKYYFKPTFDVPLITIPGDLLNDHDDVQLNDFLQKSIRGQERAWLVVSPDRYIQEDKNQFVRTGWFDYNTFMFSHPEVKLGVTIYGYTFKLIPGTNVNFFPHTAKTDYTFGDALSLEGYDYVSPNGIRYGDWLHLTLFWRKLNLDQSNYSMTVRLLDKDGRDTATNYDSLPLNGYFTTDKWHINESVRDYRNLFIHVPPGEYRLEVSVYPVANPQTPLLVNGSEQGRRVEGATKILLDKPITVGG